MNGNDTFALAAWYRTESVWNCAGGAPLPGDKFRPPFRALKRCR